MSIEIGIAISVLSLCFSIFFGLKNNKRNDTKEIEQRTKEHTEVTMRLDEICRNVTDIKADIISSKKDIQLLEIRLTATEASVKSAHHRIDEITKKERE